MLRDLGFVKRFPLLARKQPARRIPALLWVNRPGKQGAEGRQPRDFVAARNPAVRPFLLPWQTRSFPARGFPLGPDGGAIGGHKRTKDLRDHDRRYDSRCIGRDVESVFNGSQPAEVALGVRHVQP